MNNVQGIFRQMLRQVIALQSCTRSWIGSFSTTNMAVITVRTTPMLATPSIPQILSCEATSAFRITLHGTQNKKNLLYSPGQKLSRCGPQTRKSLGIVPLQVPLRPLPHLIHSPYLYLWAHPLCQRLTSNIPTPTSTGSSPGQLTQCLIRLPLTSPLDIFWPLQRVARCTIRVLLKHKCLKKFWI